MAKGGKIAIIGVGSAVVVIGASYVLAKIGIIPVKKLANSNKMVASGLHSIGLYKAPKIKKTASPAVDPLADQRKELAAQKAALDAERSALHTQASAPIKVTPSKTASISPLDPKELARMAAVYEQMTAEVVTKIFVKLPDEQVIALLRQMDEKKVAKILEISTPERAARLTMNLSRAPAPISDRTTANTL